MASNATSKGRAIVVSKTRAIVVTGFVLAVAAGVGVLRSDLLLNRGFGNALEASRPGLSFDTARSKGAGPGRSRGR